MKSLTLILLSLLLAAWWTQTYAQDSGIVIPEPLVLTDEQSQYPLGLHLELLEDPGGELTIEDVTSPEYADQFSPSVDEVPNFGFTDSAYWVRLRLRDENPLIDTWLLGVDFENTHFVDLYSPSADGAGFEVRQTGAMRSPSTRDILYPQLVFELTPPKQSEETYYLRFKNGAPMILALTLWKPAAFFADSLLHSALVAIFLGVMAGLLGYNLFLFVSLRDVNYLYLALLLTAAAIYEASQTSFLEVYLLPDLYRLKQHAIALSSAGLLISLILFYDSFLAAKMLMPNVHRLNLFLLGFAVLLGLATFITTYHNIAIFMAPTIVVITVVGMISVVIAWRRGFRAARFLVIAMIGLLAGLLLFILGRMGIISNSLLTENAFRFGFVWMAVCSSLALADRINLLKSETEQANRELIHSEQRLSQTLEAMPVGVVVYGPDQRPTYINKRTVEILTNPARGIGPDPNFERTLPEAMSYYSFRVSGSDQAYPLKKFPVYQALQGEPSHADDIEADLVDRRVPLEAWASPVFDETGHVETAVIAFQDITLRKEQQAELDGYRQHLEQLVEERTEELNAINEQLAGEVTERAVLEGLLHKRIEWMSAMSLARQSVRGTADLQGAYEELSEKIRLLLDAGTVFLLCWDGQDESGEFLCRLIREGPALDTEGIRASLPKDSPLRREIEQGKPLVFSAGEVASLPVPLQTCLAGDGVDSLLLMPMHTGEVVSGVLGLAVPQNSQSLTQAQNELVAKIALDLAGLNEYATFLDQSRALFTAEERNRLARDLHDSVTQVLFSASLVAEVLPQIWRRDPERAMQSLEELRRLTRGALAEMRTMLLELRPSAVVKSPLHELLAQLTEATTSRTELPFKLLIERTPPLPEDVHAAIYRIAQEALNNIVKHAHASLVTLDYRTLPLSQQQAMENIVGVGLVIEDDGIGFSPEDEQIEHLGLGIMRERASDIKADLDINSRIGEGTRVTLTWCGEVAIEENE